jgi:hypothetical protein
MTSDRWAQAVREQIRLGRVVPLGGPADPAWIVERAAVGVLRSAASRVEGVRLGALRVDSAGPGTSESGAPPDALPHALPRRPLRVEAGLRVASGTPVPAAADRLRRALWEAAHARVGLDVIAVDLNVTGLMERDEPGRNGGDGQDTLGGAPATAHGAGFTGLAATVVSALPGVAGLSSRLGGFSPGVRVRDDHAEAQVVVAAGHRALDVALAVRDALVKAVGVGTVTVVVSELA